MLSELTTTPAFWGAAGAFIYAANELYACLFQNRDTRGHVGQCLFKFLLSIGVGAAAAAAFGPAARSWIGHDQNAVCAMIGLLANPMSPKLVELCSAALSGVLKSRLVALLKGELK